MRRRDDLVNAVALAGGYTPRADRGSVTVPATQVLPSEIVRVPARFF
jgi:hypothetical protein